MLGCCNSGEALTSPRPCTVVSAVGAKLSPVTLPLMFAVPVTASALLPMVAPPSASDVPVATPSAGVTSVGDVENTTLVEVVPVVPVAAAR